MTLLMRVCAQPLCAPVQHCFGCGSSAALKRSVAVVLLVDFMYGVAMVVLHAVLIGQSNQDNLFDAPAYPPVAVQGKIHVQQNDDAQTDQNASSWTAQVSSWASRASSAFVSAMPTQQSLTPLNICIGASLCVGFVVCFVVPLSCQCFGILLGIFIFAGLILCVCMAWTQISSSLDLASTPQVSYTHTQLVTPLVFHRGEDCWSSCHNKSGACQWCGPGNACCREGVNISSMQDTCHSATGFHQGGTMYECVRPFAARLLYSTTSNDSMADGHENWSHESLSGHGPSGSITDATEISNPRKLVQFNGNDDRSPHWLIQFADLDLSWGHFLFGYSDGVCLLAGLLYGLVVTSCTACTLDVGARGCVPRVPAWFLPFTRLQLIVYLFQCALKYQHVCDLRQQFFPALETTCDSLRFSFVQRVVMGLFLAALGLWILESFVEGIDEEDHRPRFVHTRGLSKVPVRRVCLPGIRSWNVHHHQPAVLYQQVATEPPPRMEYKPFRLRTEPSGTEPIQIIVDNA
eukprot:gnl/MRDRNA2_/MRDRNA2_100452_c0_seq1.p1 gnl/MRDRNA2_/MRDRNA2_100452_c0~~gnl/MRDRNA2_/MRDRNA2_100452_c0_seq1.p1  ORF type:complete len:518 (+),score=40.52 gnl/MRDRNA2_/MRDRNA2_100452_c0_seq1:79-1632(+)